MHRRIADHWGEILGCDPSLILSPGASVVRWGTDSVEFLVWEDGAVIAAPPRIEHGLRERVGQLSLPFGREAAQSLVEPHAGSQEVLGPQFVGYCDRSRFSPVKSDAERIDPSSLLTLRDACPREEWDRSGVRFGKGGTPTFGVIRESRPVAVAQFESVHGVAGIAIISQPEYRGEGYATEVVSKATEVALSEGLLPEYRTIERWSSSVALAERLGFTRVARSILVEIS